MDQKASIAATLERNTFRRFASGLRWVAWAWLLCGTIYFATQLDLARVLAVELSGVLALELAAAAALVFGPGTVGLALSSVIERVSYLASDLNLL
jgi:hypothetical protein